MVGLTQVGLTRPCGVWGLPRNAQALARRTASCMRPGVRLLQGTALHLTARAREVGVLGFGASFQHTQSEERVGTWQSVGRRMNMMEV